MYHPWLIFFHSAQQEIQNQPITKEWLEQGSMKISGTYPSAWSILLQPATQRPYYLDQYQIQEEKQQALYQMRQALETRNKDDFSQADRYYESLKEKESQGKSWLEKQEKRINILEDNVFTAKQELYQLRNETRKKDYFQRLRTLEEKIRTLTNEKRNLQMEQEERLQNYSADNPSLRQNGPVPPVPTSSVSKKKKPPVQEGGGSFPEEDEEHPSSHKIQVIKVENE